MSTMLGEWYNDTSGSKEVTGLIIHIYKESYEESFNFNPSPIQSDSLLDHYFFL